MTDAHEPNEMDGPHEGPIKTPRQLILAVLFAFLVPIFGIILLVMYVSTEERLSAGSDALGPKAVAERIRPVGHVEIKDASDAASMKTGEQVFAAQCTACHTAGVLGSPKFGDATAWAPRIKTGYDALLHSALAGKGQMPPQGGGDFSDFEIGRAVVYMANKAGAKFAEPAAPAPAASGATTAAATPAPATEVKSATPGTAAVVEAPAKSASPVAPAPATTMVAAAPAKADAAATPALFMQICAVCHAQGVAGAPKLGDKAAWAPRIAQGIDALTASVIKGKGAMPPKGGSVASDAEIKAVVTYMVNAAK
jgi:cytochrome c5